MNLYECSPGEGEAYIVRGREPHDRSVETLERRQTAGLNRPGKVVRAEQSVRLPADLAAGRRTDGLACCCAVGQSAGPC